MAQYTHCDRCGDNVDNREQSWEVAIRPLRFPRGEWPADKLVELCTPCLRGLQRYLEGDEVQRSDGPCAHCGKSVGELVHTGWLHWAASPCDGSCGYGGGEHTHHAFVFDELRAKVAAIAGLSVLA